MGKKHFIGNKKFKSCSGKVVMSLFGKVKMSPFERVAGGYDGADYDIERSRSTCCIEAS